MNPRLERRRTQPRIGDREIDRAIFVSDHLPRALELCGLTRRDLGPVAHYVDHFLVTVAVCETEFLLHCGAEVDLTAPFDWVTPSIERLLSNEKFFVANPYWTVGDVRAPEEALRYEPPYYVGEVLSDQIFLVKRSLLAGPVYNHKDPKCRWFPLADIGATFEKRVTSMMGQLELLRLTDSRVGYVHAGTQGAHYPRRSFWNRARGRLKRSVRRLFALAVAGSGME